MSKCPQVINRLALAVSVAGALSLSLATPVWCGETEAPGVRIDLVMRETIDSDPPISEIIDTLSAVMRFDTETTMRVANAIAYLTATPVLDSAIQLEYAIYIPGPVPDQRIDRATIEYGVPLILDNIKGKGKSSYRLTISAFPATAPAGIRLPQIDGEWLVNPSTYYLFHLDPQSLGVFHYLQLRRALEFDWEAVRDTLAITSTSKTDFFFVEGNCTDVILDPRFDFAVDPSRNRVVARYDHAYTGVDVRAMILTQILRWWGYAPEFLSIGAAGLQSLSDREVLMDRREGNFIPLASLVRNIDFKRAPFPAADHHAASFCRWLISTRGAASFRDLYSKATDLSLERALWSVYGKTLAELESDWLAHLERRTFTATELYVHALRYAGYRDYQTYYDLLLESTTLADSVPARIYRDLGLGAAQLGRWDECARHFEKLVELSPADMSARGLLGEALWARGDTTAAEYQARVVLRTDPSDPQAYILMGDLQMARRRIDSAMTLWQAGVMQAPDIGASRFELNTRIGRLLRNRHNRDSANALFLAALESARAMLASNPQDPLTLSRMGEALAECDSLEAARGFLEIAAYAADAPQDLARIGLASGRLHDLAGERAKALEAYEYVLAIPSPHYYADMARHYLNTVYGKR